MKLSIYFAAAMFFASSAVAGQIGSGGVQSIKDNGRINGDQSWTITCNSGWGVVRRNGKTWTDSMANTYSNRLWNLSLEDLAKQMCE
jgi:hypothetical protein